MARTFVETVLKNRGAFSARTEKVIIIPTPLGGDVNIWGG